MKKPADQLARYLRGLRGVRLTTARRPFGTTQLGFVVRELVLGRPGRLVVYIGHGEEDRLRGNEPFSTLTDPLGILPNEMVTADVADGVLDDAIVVAIACSSGATLAPQAVRDGVRAWVGAPKPLVVTENETEFPYGDVINESFSAVPVGLAAGLTVSDSLALYRDRCDEILRALEDPSLQFGEHYSSVVRWNKEQLRVYGKGDVRWTDG